MRSLWNLPKFMPLYFAYGANMNAAGMAARCKGARAVGVARLMRHKFMIMPEGWASVERDMHKIVYGVLWEVSFAHIRALDVYEDIARGLYSKITQPVIKADGGSVRALIYVGRRAAHALASAQTRAQADYMADVIASAQAQGLPDAYIRELCAHMPSAAGIKTALRP
jgi:gamma-glutamylcyclotransferase (GGCT)/AIG2-like uncharacterized protein YtfP